MEKAFLADFRQIFFSLTPNQFEFIGIARKQCDRRVLCMYVCEKGGGGDTDHSKKILCYLFSTRVFPTVIAHTCNLKEG